VNVDTVRQERFNVERALAVRSAEFRTQLALSHAGVSDMIAALPANSAIVAFVEYGRVELTRSAGRKVQEIEDSTPSYAVFVFSPASAAPLVIPLADTATIDTIVTRYREARAREARSAGRASRAGEASYRKAAEDLRRVVWDPVASHLGTAMQVFIVPDGALNLVTFAALPIGEARYLVEDGRTFHYLSAERDLLAPSKASSHGGLLSLSNPDFDDRRLFAALGAPGSRATPVPEERTESVFRGSRSACGTFQAMRFEPLSATLRESKEIARIWDDQVKGSTSLRSASGSAESAVSFTGSAANETLFKHTASGHRVLHLATHGFFLGGDCGSALDSPTAEGTSEASSAVTRENPLLLSGLVFAGANHREAAGPDEDDGILTAEEIATLDLQGTEWAVLSACDTGAGEIRGGEGVFGLRRAFQLAGARTVIMSLWPVEDEATRQWMTALYRHRFVEGKSTAASVNGASLELLRQRRARGESTHPFYWAGFIAAGAWQ
jgi:CHAT domain-containing protein